MTYKEFRFSLVIIAVVICSCLVAHYFKVKSIGDAIDNALFDSPKQCQQFKEKYGE